MSDQEMTEIVPVADTFASGIGRVEDVGNGMFRLWLYALQNGERIVVAKIIMAAAMFPANAEIIATSVQRATQAAQALGAFLQ